MFSALALCISPRPAAAQGTALTYQGRLNDGGSPANGNYDLRFAIYDAVTVGTQQGSLLTNSTTPVSNGLFTVTLDFGNQFPGAARWLEIAVRTNGAASFFTLSPRQALTPTPYAITAGNVISGGLAAGTYGNAVTLSNAANQFTGSFSGNGTSVTNVNAVSLNGINATNFWQTGGNNVSTNQILGSTNFQPVQVFVNGTRALRLEPTTNDPSHTGIVNVVGGSPANFVQPGTYGSFVGGGGATNYGGNGGGNRTAADMSFVGGGLNNSILSGSTESFLGGGFNDVIQSNAMNAVLIGGYANSILAAPGVAPTESFLGGGFQNSIQPDGLYSFLGGGGVNSINASYSVIVGGSGNSIQTPSSDSVIVGGDNNSIQTNNALSFIGGGGGNIIQFTPGSGGGNSVIGGGANNVIGAACSSAFIGGGNLNQIQANPFTGSPWAIIVAGYQNIIVPGSSYSVIGGGILNSNAGAYSTVPGGTGNYGGGAYSFAAGQRAKANFQGDFVWADSQGADFLSTSNDQFLVRAKGGVGINNNNPGTNALSVSGTVSASVFSGNGSGLSNLNISQVSGGTLSLAQLPYGVVTNTESFVPLTDLIVATNLFLTSGNLWLPQPAYISSGGTLMASVDTNANAYFGLSAGNNNVSSVGSFNVGLGQNAMYYNTLGSNNVAIGNNALITSTADNGVVAIGSQALASDNFTPGFLFGSSANTAVGYQALQADNSGAFNTALGYSALNHDTSGYQNVAIGTDALDANTGGYNNIAIGAGAGTAITGNNNIDIGNAGTGSDSAITRIGTEGVQGTAYIAGIVESDGLLTGGTITSASITCSGNVSGSQLVSSSGILTSGPIACTNISSSGNVTCASLTITGGSDLAEPFEIANTAGDIPKGSVMVIDDTHPGELKVSSEPYDTHVAGVLSGANGIKPGLQMKQMGVLQGDSNLALSGRVYVQADISNGVIKPGDLLTTSSQPGHAMKVTDHARAAGAILGKAMTGLSEGKGMVLVLVTLQ